MQDEERFLVVVNAEGQHALWRSGLAVPLGWSVVHGPAGRAACLEFVATHWTDMRPKSLRDAAGPSAAAQPGS